MHRAIATLLLIAAPLPAAAQGVLRGTVRSTQGEMLVGASIAIPGTTLSTRTDRQGMYRIPLVPAGTVRVHAGAIGHAFVDTTVALTGGDSTTLDFTLRPEPLALPPVDVVSDRVPQATGPPPRSRRSASES